MTPKKNPRPPACAACAPPAFQRACMQQGGKASPGCPTLLDQELLARANQAYQDPVTREFARQASKQEAACYANRDQRPYTMQPTKTRLVEIAEFAQRLGYQRLGLAFCIGLANEAKVVAQLLGQWGFEVISAACKAGATPKESLGLGEEDKIHQGEPENMCNPVFQAQLLNQAGTQFNVLLGLCVGHDSLFFQHALAPSTVLAVKDRVTGHNPLAAIYTSGTYYRKIGDPSLA
ncbi:MAG: DUF1847 domain-containing protein [Pseudomonadota bacterium]